MTARVTKLLCAVLLLSVAACSPSADEAGKAVETFYQRLNAGDYTGAIELYGPEAAGAVRDPGGAPSEPFAEWARTETRDGSVSEIRVVDSTVTGERAEIQFDVVYAGGETARRTVPLTRVQGEWKLGFIE